MTRSQKALVALVFLVSAAAGAAIMFPVAAEMTEWGSAFVTANLIALATVIVLVTWATRPGGK